MKDVEVLIKLIIPAILLIFWALSNLFNREQKVEPQQRRERTSSLGPRPGSAPPRDRQAGAPAAYPARYPAANDEILIIRPEPNRPTPRPGSQPRRANPGRRSNAAPASRKPEPQQKPKEQLGGRIATEVSQVIDLPMDLRPLTQQISSYPQGMSPVTTAATVVSSVEAATQADNLRSLLGNQARIREAFVLNEVLQPPLAMRRRRRA